MIEDEAPPGAGLDGSDQEAREVNLARELDQQTWSAWYDRYYPTIFRYALVRLGSKEEAEDVASQVFVNSIQRIDSFHYRGRPVLAWLYRIAHNLVADRLRSRRPLIGSHDTLSLPEDASQGWTETVLDGVLLRTALSALKESQREVIVLRFFAHLSIKEVSAALDKSEGAVQSLQIRGIEALRRELGPAAGNSASRNFGRPATKKSGEAKT